MQDRQLEIAVVGTGIAGLTAARLLHRRHRVTVLEADQRIGGHANTVTVDDPRGELAIDTGFIVMNDRNYPLLTDLFRELGVETQPAEMGMSIATGDGGFEFANTRRGLFAQRANLVRPRFWGLIRDQLRFNRDARAMIGRADGPTVGEFLADCGYSRWFVERAIAPEIAAVWSADPAAIWEFPLAFLAEFLDNHGQLQLRGRPQWRTVAGGSREYVSAIAEPFRDRVHTGAAVRRIERISEGVLIEADGRETEAFDHVVLAVHSDQALSMLAAPSAAEREVLEAIPYRPNEAVLHTDASLMPRRRRAWASWNFHLGEEGGRSPEDGGGSPEDGGGSPEDGGGSPEDGGGSPEDGGGSQITYWMNNLQRLDAERDYFVTLNRREMIDPEKVLEVVAYAHPQFSHAGHAAQRRWPEISGSGPIHYCGAHWRWGFHEDGCWSAHRVCASPAFGAGARTAAVGGLELAA